MNIKNVVRYEEVKSALGIVTSKAGKCDEAIKNIRNFVTK